MTAALLAGCTEHSWETSVCLLAVKPGALWQPWECSHYRLWQPHIMTNIPLPSVSRQPDCSCTKWESFSDCICKIQSIFTISDSNLGRKNGKDFSVCVSERYCNNVVSNAPGVNVTSMTSVLWSETAPSTGQNYCSTTDRIQCSIKRLFPVMEIQRPSMRRQSWIVEIESAWSSNYPEFPNFPVKVFFFFFF